MIIAGIVLKIDKIKSSAMGNPAYSLTIDTADGVVTHRTAANASIAYAVSGFMIGRSYVFTATSRGRIIAMAEDVHCLACSVRLFTVGGYIVGPDGQTYCPATPMGGHAVNGHPFLPIFE